MISVAFGKLSILFPSKLYDVFSLLLFENKMIFNSNVRILILLNINSSNVPDNSLFK